MSSFHCLIIPFSFRTFRSQTARGKKIIQNTIGILNARGVVFNRFIIGYRALLPGICSFVMCGSDVTLEENDRLRLRICLVTLSFQSSDNSMQLRHNCK